MNNINNILDTCHVKYGNINIIIAAILLNQRKYNIIVFGGLLRDLIANMPINDVDILVIGSGNIEYDHHTRTFKDYFFEDLQDIFISSPLLSKYLFEPILFKKNEFKINNFEKYFDKDVDDSINKNNDYVELSSSKFKTKIDHIKYSLILNGHKFLLDVSFVDNQDVLKTYAPACNIDSLFVTNTNTNIHTFHLIDSQFDSPSLSNEIILDNIKYLMISNIESYFDDTKYIINNINNKTLRIIDITHIKRLIKLTRFILDESYTLDNNYKDHHSEIIKLIYKQIQDVKFDSLDSLSQNKIRALLIKLQNYLI